MNTSDALTELTLTSTPFDRTANLQQRSEDESGPTAVVGQFESRAKGIRLVKTFALVEPFPGAQDTYCPMSALGHKPREQDFCFRCALGRYPGEMTVSASGSVDPYLRVASAIREEIKERRLEPGTKLTPSRELAQRFSVSEMTVGNAIRLLRDQGVVTTTKRGTFVLDPEGNRAEDPDLARQVADLKEQVRDLTERVAAIESQQ